MSGMSGCGDYYTEHTGGVIMNTENRAFYFDSGEKDTPEGNYCVECWGMGKIATDYILPRTGAPDECYCTHCKGTGIEPEKVAVFRWEIAQDRSPRYDLPKAEPVANEIKQARQTIREAFAGDRDFKMGYIMNIEMLLYDMYNGEGHRERVQNSVAEKLLDLIFG